MAVAYVKRMIETTQGEAIEIICAVDADSETRDALLEIDGPIRVTYAESLVGAPRAWNRALAKSDGEFFLLATDDGWPHDEWLTNAKSAMQKLPGGSGYVGLNDLHNDGKKLATSGLIHRDFLVNHMGGVIAFECYGHYYQDTEAFERAKRADKFVYEPSAIIEHIHPAARKRKIDDTDIMNMEHWNRDFTMFQNRMQAGFPDDFEPVLKE